MAPEPTGTHDVRTYLRIFWRWKLLLLAFLVLIPLGAYLVERGQPKTYQSSTLIQLQGSSLGGSPVPSTNLQAVARLVTTTPVADRAAQLMHPPPVSAGSLLGGVSATADPNTGFLTITATDRDPNRAAMIATVFAAALDTYQSAQTIHTIGLQTAALAKQLAKIPRGDQGSRAAVTQQLAQLRAQAGATSGAAQVIQPAVASATPVGPKTRRAVELAFVIALLLGIGAVLGAENTDRKLRTPEDLEHLTGMPLLGVIPPSAFSSSSHDTPRDDEAFQMLSAALIYFNVDRPISSVAIVSPLRADGKTTVAVGLAVATARAGKQAILVDADLRSPQVCNRLAITPNDGLGAVLAGEREATEVMVEHAMDAPAGGRLLVLPAGSPPANPAAAIGSQQMRELLRQLEEQADLVIVDTAAALAVSDALPLLHAASGVAMIVRMNRTSAAVVRRLQKVIASAHGTFIGVVATGSAPVGGGYGYVYGYSQDGRGGRWLAGLRRPFTRGREPAPRPSAADTAAPLSDTSGAARE